MSILDIGVMGTDANQPLLAKALAYLTNLYMFNQGRAEVLVPIPGYRVDPSLTVEELIDTYLNSKLKNIGLAPPSTPFITVADVAALVADYIIRLRQLEDMRKGVLVLFTPTHRTFSTGCGLLRSLLAQWISGINPF